MPQIRPQPCHRRDWTTDIEMGVFSSWHQVRLTLRRTKTSLIHHSLENWDEWARRQYQQKVPSRPNPYGEEEEPKHFRDFHIFEKLRVIHQLSVWTFWNPDRIRQAMPDVKEADQYYDWVSFSPFNEICERLTSLSKHIPLVGTNKTESTTI